MVKPYTMFLYVNFGHCEIFFRVFLCFQTNQLSDSARSQLDLSHNVTLDPKKNVSVSVCNNCENLSTRYCQEVF